MSELFDCRLRSHELHRLAQKNAYDGHWSIVALAAANYDLAAAVYGLTDLFEWASAKYLGPPTGKAERSQR